MTYTCCCHNFFSPPVLEYLIDALPKFPFMLSTVFHHERECNIKFTDLNKFWDCRLCCFLIHCTIRIFFRRSAAARFLGLRVRIPPGHECLSLVNVICCQVPATSRSVVKNSPTDCIFG